MQRKAKRVGVIVAAVLAASFAGAGVASASPTVPQQQDCGASLTPNNGAAASCPYTYPGTIQVVIECTNTAGVPYPVTIYGPAVPAEAHNASIATCDNGEDVTNYFAVYQP